jgi:hypothetical protein
VGVSFRERSRIAGSNACFIIHNYIIIFIMETTTSTSPLPSAGPLPSSASIPDALPTPAQLGLEPGDTADRVLVSLGGLRYYAQVISNSISDIAIMENASRIHANLFPAFSEDDTHFEEWLQNLPETSRVNKLITYDALFEPVDHSTRLSDLMLNSRITAADSALLHMLIDFFLKGEAASKQSAIELSQSSTPLIPKAELASAEVATITRE